MQRLRRLGRREARPRAEGATLSDAWPRDGFDARLARADRVVVLYSAGWSPFSRSFLPVFERAEPEASVPFARADLHHPLDPRWDDHRIAVVPTVAYYEHGEELERVEAARGRGMDRRAFDAFLDDVEGLQEKWRYRHGRLQLDRSG